MSSANKYMNIISIILRSLGYLLIALIVISSTYLILMSGIYHTPTTFLSSSNYVSPSNKILIVGGTRGAGLEIARKLLDRGEDVTAMVRSTSNVEKLNQLGVKQVIADALIKEQVQAIFSQNSYGTVISALGTSAKDLPSRQNFIQSMIYGQVKMDPNKRPDFIGNRNIIDSAKTFGANRFILITVIGTGQSHDALPLPARRGHNEVIPLKAKAENHLRDSGLAFTIIRPGGFSNGQSSGKAKLTEDHLAFSYIARVDVANLAIEALGNDESIGKTFNAYDSDMLHLYRIFMD
jgi:uncharacterized protein YbjT (DUF2867 family)